MTRAALQPAEEVAVAFVDVNGVSVAVGHIAESMFVYGDVGRQDERHGRRRAELADADARPYVMLRHTPRVLPSHARPAYIYLFRNSQLSTLHNVVKSRTEMTLRSFRRKTKTRSPQYSVPQPKAKFYLFVYLPKRNKQYSR